MLKYVLIMFPLLISCDGSKSKRAQGAPVGVSKDKVQVLDTPAQPEELKPAVDEVAVIKIEDRPVEKSVAVTAGPSLNDIMSAELKSDLDSGLKIIQPKQLPAKNWKLISVSKEIYPSGDLFTGYTLKINLRHAGKKSNNDESMSEGEDVVDQFVKIPQEIRVTKTKTLSYLRYVEIWMGPFLMNVEKGHESLKVIDVLTKVGIGHVVLDKDHADPLLKLVYFSEKEGYKVKYQAIYQAD